MVGLKTPTPDALPTLTNLAAISLLCTLVAMAVAFTLEEHTLEEKIM